MPLPLLPQSFISDQNMNSSILFSLLCLSLPYLSSSSTSVTHHHSNPVLEGGAASLLQHDSEVVQRRYRRQDSTEQLQACMNAAQAIRCETGGLIQETAELAARCNQSSVRLAQLYSCARNSDGEYCSQVVARYINNITDTSIVCASSYMGECTDECGTHLNTLRDSLGCCISDGSLSNLLPNLHNPFSSQLLTSCSLQPVQPCTIQIPDTTEDVDPVCSTDDYTRQSNALQCEARHVRPLLEAAEGLGCEAYQQSFLEQCSVDDSGEWCYTRADVLSIGMNFAIINCINLEECGESCETTLRELFSAGGCCVNALFNGSLVGPETMRQFLSYEFVTRCGLEGPGSCEVRIIGGDDSMTTTEDDETTTTRGRAATFRPFVGIAVMGLTVYILATLIF